MSAQVGFRAKSCSSRRVWSSCRAPSTRSSCPPCCTTSGRRLSCGCSRTCRSPGYGWQLCRRGSAGNFLANFDSKCPVPYRTDSCSHWKVHSCHRNNRTLSRHFPCAFACHNSVCHWARSLSSSDANAGTLAGLSFDVL